MSDALAVRDPVVVQLETARRYLAEATDLSEVKRVADMAASAEVFAKRQELGDELVGLAHRVKTEALARLGELLKAMPKATGAAGIGPPVIAVPKEDRDQPPTLAEIGITKKVSSVAQQLASLPPETREAIAAREMTLTEARRQQKEERREERR